MKHDHICEYKHFFEDRNNCYILLELCHNQSMNEMIKRRKRLTEPETVYFMIQLINSVKYMHDSFVIHRDLKLGNLFLDRNMNIKVGDFGLATRLESEEEKRKTICGTPNYIAPEVIQGSREERGHSFEVDVWSMGVILYTTLYGKPPYESKDVKATYKRIIANDYYFPSTAEVSDEAKDLITSMLQSNPADRPKLDELMRHPFFDAQCPEFLPPNAHHVAPEWTLTEEGKLVAVEQSRQPFGSRDVNQQPRNDATKKRGEPVKLVSVASTSSFPSSIKNVSRQQRGFQIYDESEQQKTEELTVPPTCTPASVQEMIAKAATLTIGGCVDAAKTPKRSPNDSDAEVLQRVLERLTSALDMAESRKFSYTPSVLSPPLTPKGGPSIWVKRYVDYTSKYGLGFLLNDGR